MTKNKKNTPRQVTDDRFLRLVADYENLKKRCEVEKQLWLKFSAERVLTQLLPVLDNFEAALKNLGDQGLAIAVSEFRRVLSGEGLVEIVAQKGEPFDALLHEAVEICSGGVQNTISETVLKGWKYKDGKVLRFAKVKVYK